ncbi:GtrA family protein [Sporolactobacillus sp. Y61]|uniref:GtrA family protein n=1 Tax=Sporolactobacillus sp. Y61 TaxID=3160863 RepID=A0AAU8IBP8_9BACL
MSDHSRTNVKRASARRLNSQVIKQAFIFGLVGISNTVVDFLIFFLLTHFIHIFYAAAQVVSYGSGMLNSYFLNAKVTFSSSRKSRTRFIKFVILNISVLCLTLVVMHSLLFLPLYLNKLISTGVGMVFNFVLSKVWVFRD